jgi:enolase-phosphatase E1
VTVSLRDRGIRAVVLDIEGTTTPIAFVYEVLFPFARRHLRAFLRGHGESEAVRAALLRLREEWAADVARGDAPPAWSEREEPNHDRAESGAPAAVPYLEWLMDRDRKSPGLKAIQGMIWEGGYREGRLRGDVFPDVPPALARLRAASLDLAIYSSGSELSQRLIFGHTSYGDLTASFSRFFDTSVGAKMSASSYRRIAGELKRSPAEILFVSDVVAELSAAREAGLQAVLCIRPGNREQPEHAFAIVKSLDDIV